MRITDLCRKSWVKDFPAKGSRGIAPGELKVYADDRLAPPPQLSYY